MLKYLEESYVTGNVSAISNSCNSASCHFNNSKRLAVERACEFVDLTLSA